MIMKFCKGRRSLQKSGRPGAGQVDEMACCVDESVPGDGGGGERFVADRPPPLAQAVRGWGSGAGPGPD